MPASGCRPGARRSGAHCSAQREPDAVAQAVGLPPASAAAALTTTQQLATDLRATQYRGYALLDQEDAPGVRSIAAPVPAADGPPRMAVEILGPVARMSDAELERLARAVQDSARGARRQITD